MKREKLFRSVTRVSSTTIMTNSTSNAPDEWAQELANLPEELRSSAVRIGNDFAWKPEDVVRVVQALTENMFAILGAEILIPAGSDVQVFPWFYKVRAQYDGDWNSYIHKCRDEFFG